MTNLVLPEINSKLFVRKANNIVKNQIRYNKNFFITNAKTFKLIKNIIEMELFLGQRPKIIASYLRKSLVINLKITKNDLYLLPWLQKSPVLWKKYRSQLNLFDYYSLPPFSAANRVKTTVTFNKISNYHNWLKSAYLD